MVARILDNAETIMRRIAEQRSLPADEVQARIRAKQAEYGGLLTEAGAAYSIAKELGVDTGLEGSASATADVKLAGLDVNAASVNVTARVVSVLPPKDFKGASRSGRLASAQISDGTATRRLVLWDDKAGLAEKMKPGDTLRVEAAYIRPNRGEIELHLGARGRVEITAAKEMTAPQAPVKGPDITKISDLGKEDKGKSIRATIVDIFPPTIIEVCAKCGAMVRQGRCEKCGSPESRLTLIVNAELDDGTGVIRAAFYRQNAERLLGFSGQQLREQADLFRLRKKTILGEEKVFSGDARYVREFDRMEFIVRIFSEFDVLSEIERLNR